MTKKIIIGSRSSKLALFQSNFVLEKLKKIFPKKKIQIKEIKTKGDILLDQVLDSSIGKGFFVNEIQKKLINKEIDIAVHSIKDLPTENSKDLTISAILKRGNYQDVFIYKKNKKNLLELTSSDTIATSSLRRKVQLKKINPNIKIIDIRGNIDTRILKMNNGYCDGLIIAAAGVERLGMKKIITEYLDSDIMLNAPGQGAIAVETRKNDKEINSIVLKLDHKETRCCVEAERSFLNELKGGCSTPFASYAFVKNGILTLEGMISSIDGEKYERLKIKSKFDNPIKLGIRLAKKILKNGGEDILNEIKNKK
jgi:hydroxymethylbilane synthase|tara:strand:+ start:25661 stop:26593 length:933 start_codon:yes stop_codon:yes gene_type:complete